MQTLYARIWRVALPLMVGLRAQIGLANVVGGDLQNFNAVPGGIDFVTVQSSETLEPGYFNISLMLNHAVNSLPYYQNESTQQNRVRYNDSLTMLDVGLGVGLGDSLEVGFAAQDLVDQRVDDASSHGEFGAKGVLNYRFYGKYRVLGDDAGGVALISSALFNRVRNNPYVGDGGSPVGIVELAGDTTFSEIAVSVNVGFRFRKKGEPIAGYRLQPMGNQYIGSVGVSYLLPLIDTKLVTEIYGARPASTASTGLEARQASSAEWLAGIKYDLTNEVSMHVGGGTELMHGTSTPDWRAYAGVNWAMGPALERAPLMAKPLQPTASASEERAVLHNINFATGSDTIPDDAQSQLVALAAQIQLSPYVSIVVEGHTDSVGSASSNQELSMRRAETVRRWLIDNAGVEADKITAFGRGEDYPIADNGNFQGRERNRRVEVRVQREAPAPVEEEASRPE